MSAADMFDWEVEYVKNSGHKVVITIGYAESGEAAVTRVMDTYGRPAAYRDWHAVSAKALRIVKEHCPENTQIAALRAAGDEHARYVLSDERGREAYAEHGGGHIRTAFDFLTSSHPTAKWKTVKLLKTLRQAFREDSVNGHDDYIADLFKSGPTRAAVSGYLSGARCRDRAHHGSHTF